MKAIKTTIVLLLLGFSIAITAQNSSGGPDIFGYTFLNSSATNGPQYQWFDISTIGTVVSGLSDDNFVGPYAISGFKYYGSTPSQLYIGSNGYIAFNAVNISSTGATFVAIPTLGGPNNFIAPFLSDLTFGGAATNPAQCFFYNQGDTICITWEGVPFWVNNTNQYAGDNSFQVILNKQDSSVTFNFKKQTGTPDPVYTNNYISIGIENPTGNDGLQYYRGDTTQIAFTSVKYTYPTTVAPSTDVGIEWIDNSGNGGFFKTIGQSYAPSVNIKNLGNQNVSSPFYVGYQLIDPANSIIDTGSVLVSGITPGTDTTINLPTTSTFIAADRYDLKAFCTIPNDNVISNDSSSLRLIVLDTSLTSHFLDYTNRAGSFFSISWTGGNGGIATYYEPPYYPARVLTTNFYITTVGNPPVGFHSILYDDNGRQGAHGTILDSSFIPSAQIFPNSYYSHPVIASNIIIQSGGVYLLWLMGGDGIGLARAIESPASRQSYEVLFGSWAPYRDNGTEDFYMGIEIAPITTGLKEGSSSLGTFKVYPNPASEYVNIELEDNAITNDYQLMDINGRKVDAKILRFGKDLKLFRGNLSPGTYVLRVGKSIAKIQFTD